MFGFLVCGVTPNLVQTLVLNFKGALAYVFDVWTNIHFIPVAYCEGTSKVVDAAKTAVKSSTQSSAKVSLNVGGVRALYDPWQVRIAYREAPVYYSEGFKLRAKEALASNFALSSVIDLMDFVSLDPVRLHASIQNDPGLTKFYRDFHDSAVQSRKHRPHMLF